MFASFDPSGGNSGRGNSDSGHRGGSMWTTAAAVAGEPHRPSWPRFAGGSWPVFVPAARTNDDESYHRSALGPFGSSFGPFQLVNPSRPQRSQIDAFGLLGLVVFVALVVGALAWAATQTLNRTDRPLRILRVAGALELHPSHSLRPQRVHTTPRRLAQTDAVETLRRVDRQFVPVAWSPADSGYVARVRLGVDNVLVVLDSGSANLSVATADCVQSSMCSARDSGYRPHASASAESLDNGASVTLRYASLSVTAKRFLDSLALPVAISERDACVRGPPALEDEDRLAESLVDRVTVAAAHAMDGTHSNILGLMMPHQSQSQSQSQSQGPAASAVLEDLLGHVRRRAWGLAAYDDGRGWLVLGQEAPCLAVPRARVPLAADYRHLGAYVLNVASVRVGGLRLEHGPRWCILDTGCAETYFPAASAPELEAFGIPAEEIHEDPTSVRTFRPEELRGSAPTIEIDFGLHETQHWMDSIRQLLWPNEVPSARFTLEIPFPRWAVPAETNWGGVVGPDGPDGPHGAHAARRSSSSSSSSSLLRSTIHAGNANVESVLGDHNVMVLGIAHMRGFYWHFDLDTRTVAVGNLSVAV